MKKFAALAFGAAMSFGAYAAPATMLPPGPIYLKFSGQEQIAVGGATTYNANGIREINWGVFTITTMQRGEVQDPNQQLDPDGPPFFVDGQGGQITGMFYGVEEGDPSATNPFPAKGGYMDLYWRDLSVMTYTNLNSATTPSVRTDFNQATGFTEGTFLARLFFDTGMDLSNPNNTIVGSQVPSSGGFTGDADSFASVDTSVKGLWTEQLNSDYFTSWQGLRDLRFKNSYNDNDAWGDGSNGIFGASIDDPGQAYALPEPGALSLMGLAMVGMGAVLRRREKKAA